MTDLKAREDRQALTPAPDHVVRANEHKRRHRESSSGMARSVRAIGDLFGRELADHLTRRLEDLAEHGSEAIYHLEERIREIEQREGAMVRALTGKIEEQRAQVATYERLSSRMAAELERRAARSGKPVPDFVSEYRSWIFLTDGPF